MNTRMSKFYRDIVTHFYRHELKPSEIIKVSRYRDTRAPIPFVSKGSVEITNPDGITTTLTVSDGPVPVEVTIPGEYTIKALEESTWICFSPIPFFARNKVPNEYSFIHFKTKRILSRDLFYSDVAEIILLDGNVTMGTDRTPLEPGTRIHLEELSTKVYRCNTPAYFVAIY